MNHDEPAITGVPANPAASDGLRQVVEDRIVPGRNTYRPPLDDDLLLRSNFYELYPLDGGGSMITHSIVPDIRDEAYARRILDEGAMDEFGGLPRLDYRRFERWRTAEKSCWLNRFYWIVPSAKRYAQTGDERLARLIIDTLLDFINSCPPPADRDEVIRHMREVFYERDHTYNESTYEEIQRNESDIRYIWFDFQLASRVLHWIHAVHFLSRSPSVRREEWEKIVASLYQHALVIYYGERYSEYSKLVPGANHQSLRGLTLLYAGTFLRGFGLWEKFLELGSIICNFHSREGFFADGALKEVSPAYHAFQMWHERDAFLLSKRYGFPLDADMESRLRLHAVFLNAVSDPGGHSVALNDAYPVPTSRFMKSLHFLGDALAPRETVFFPDAGIAVLRRSDLFFLFDASVFTGRMSHYHAGKNAPILWAGDKPFFVDSGCCSYDDERVSAWYRAARAHSTLLVDGEGDGNLISIYEFTNHATLRCDGWKHGTDGSMRIAAALQSDAPSWKDIVWSRTIAVKGQNRVEIADRVDSPRAVQWTFIFNLHPDVEVALEGTCARLRNGLVRLRLDMRGSVPCEPAIEKGWCYLDFQHRESRRVVVHLRGRGPLELRSALAPE